LLSLSLAAVVAALPLPSANAAFHLWTVTEVYSSPDGSVQFIKLATGTTGEYQLNTHVITCTGPLGTHSYTFTADLPPSPGTAGHTFLIGTPSLASVPGGVTPDFVLTGPAPFLFLTPGITNTVGIQGSASPSTQFAAYTNLPTDGLLSLQGSASNLVPATNSPKNFANQSNSIVPVKFLSGQAVGTNFVLSFRTATGVDQSAGPNYAVEFKNLLTDTTWSNYTTIPGDGTTKSVSNALSSASQRFFRLNVP